MGNFCNRGENSRRAVGHAWTSWRLAIDQEQAQKTFRKMGCLYCTAFFVFGKFICLALLFALPSVMIGMGAFYINDCPRAPIIPIYLIVLGSVGIFEIYEPDYDPTHSRYCNKTLYMFAFIVVTILWIFMGIFLVMCLLLVILLACAKEDLIDEEPRQEAANRRDEPHQEGASKREEHLVVVKNQAI